MTESAIDVVIGSYNGASYLPDQLASIAAQPWRDLHIIVSDDASTDATLDVLARFTARPLTVLSDARNRGVRANFSRGLSAATAPYIFLADQDDWWREDKVPLMMARMAAIEAAHVTNRPALVFSDLAIVDRDLEVLRPSFFGSSFKQADATAPRDYVIGNHVPGCAMLVNRALLDRAMPIPSAAYLHDWWLILVCAVFGTIAYVDAPLVRYRQHGGNVLGDPGAREAGVARWARHLTNPVATAKRRLAHYRDHGRLVAGNMRALDQAFGPALPRDVADMVRALNNPNWLRRYSMLRGANTGETRLAGILTTWFLR